MIIKRNPKKNIKTDKELRVKLLGLGYSEKDLDSKSTDELLAILQSL